MMKVVVIAFVMLLIVAFPLSLVWLSKVLGFSVIAVMSLLVVAILHQTLCVGAAVRLSINRDTSNSDMQSLRVAIASAFYVSCVAAFSVASRIVDMLVEGGLDARAGWVFALPAILITVPIAFTAITILDVILFPIACFFGSSHYGRG